MVVGLRRGNMVCSFFSEDRRELGVFVGRTVLVFAASAAAASFVVAVRRAITGDPIGIKQEPHRMIRWRVLFS